MDIIALLSPWMMGNKIFVKLISRPDTGETSPKQPVFTIFKYELDIFFKACFFKYLRRRVSYQQPCLKAFDHRAEFHVQDSRVPNRHYQFGNQLGQHELRYIHAEKKRFEDQIFESKNLSINYYGT